MIKQLLSNELVIILLAALLGLILGWSLRRILAVKQAKSQEDEAQSRLKGRDRYISQLKLELSEAEEGIELHNHALQKSVEDHKQEMQEQQTRSDDYQVRMRAAESKLVNLQRNYLVFKTHKQREISQLQSSLKQLKPEQKAMQQQLYELSREEPETDMDATLEIDSGLKMEQDPYVLRNALVSEKRKVEQLQMVRKELGETYFRFAEEKQNWLREKELLENRILQLRRELDEQQEQESMSADLMHTDFN